jgi:type IV pilus assembly protein PilY1
MRISRGFVTAAVALAFTASPVRQATAEDIDLFVGAAANTANPNVLILLDNSANWSAANQHWFGGYKQGESELRALRTLVGELSDKVNFGLMMMTPGGGSGYDDGGYVRFHLRSMNAANILGFQQMIGPDTGCIDGVNALTGGENCLYKNFQAGEQVGSDKVNYSAALYEAFKYFGGYTSPANAQRDVAGSPTGKEAFGRYRYAGPIPTSESKYDTAAFIDPLAGKTQYSNWNSISCAKNYVILIGNGFPSSEPSEMADILRAVGGNPSQLPMPTFTSTEQTVIDNLGTNTGCRTVNQCVSDATALFPAGTYDSFACTGGTSGTCGSGNRLTNQTMQGLHKIFTVTPTGLSALPGSEARYADEWAQFLYTTDVSDQLGQQNVKVFTIDVFKDQPSQNQTALLTSMARYGGGKYYQASSEEAILNALREILIDIQSVNSVFAAASLPINATNRSQNENQVFIGMFRPDPSAKPRWYGNTKRYQIGLFGQEAKLADADGRDAVSTETGFIHACSRSFWTTESGTYWTFSQISAGQCTTVPNSPFSDTPDGPLVEKGATAEVVRKGNNPPTTDTTPTNVVNRAIYSCYFPSDSYCNWGPNGTMNPFDSANVWLGATIPWWEGYSPVDWDAEHARIVNFTRGQDTEDDNHINSNTDTRPSLHGDVAHSRPLPVNYGGSTGVVLYYGANDGTFKAVQGSNGKELWSFIAPEHHPLLRRLQRNEPLVLYPSMTTPYPNPTPTRKDYFFDGSAGLFQNADDSRIWVFPSMRRGGNMLHAFDVTNPTVPLLKWRRGCWKTGYSSDPAYHDLLVSENLVETADGYWCNPGYENIGQTWSTPTVALVKGFSEDPNRPVLIVGGGYDACEDVDSKTTTCTSPRGRNVYVINADTGEIQQKFGTGGTGTIDRSVASDITLVDRNFDGFADHGYFADTGGSLYRIDFIDPSTLAPISAGGWRLTKIAYTTGAGRKFLFAPAALPSAGRVYLTIGSGDRERPLISNYPYTGAPSTDAVMNRFYMLIDSFELPSVDPTVTAVNLDGSSMDNFTSTESAGCSVTTSTGSKGWFFDLNVSRGQQTVTSSSIFGGLVFFSTNHPEEPRPGVCRTELGQARGYAVNLLNASGAVGTEALCGGTRSAVFAGGGLPPSPVTGTVPVNGVPITVMIGGVQRTNPGQSAPIGAQRVRPAITQRRSRIYWYQHGDQ